MDNALKNTAKETKGVFFPSNKKLYETSMHQNSEEFKQLGTIHMENRAAEYYPLEKPQPTNYMQSPLADLQMDKMMGATTNSRMLNSVRHRTQSVEVA